MKPTHKANCSGLTWIEVLVALFILGVLVAMALPAVTGALSQGPTRGIISSMTQLWLATRDMALEGETNGDRTLGWPGDTGDTFIDWSRKLVPNYLGTNDFRQLLSTPGKKAPANRFPFEMSEGAILVYAVRSNSPDSAVFMTSANFTNTPTGGTALQKTAKPLGNKAFIVFRRDGYATILYGKQVGETNLIGSFVPLLK